MGRWSWFQRRGGQVEDPIGPAKIYGGHSGGYARGSAPAETGQTDPDPAWDAPTLIEGNAFITLAPKPRRPGTPQ